MLSSTATLRTIAAIGVALMLTAATDPAPPKRNWNTVIARTADSSHVLGNPAGKIKLTEYVSYTCAHCAEFESEADAPLRLTMIARGQGSVEVRNFVRDPIDMTVALLTHCGPPSKFFLNHTAFLRSQRTWIDC